MLILLDPQTPIVASRLCDDHSPDRSNNLQEFEDNHRSENTGPDAGESDESESATTVDVMRLDAATERSHKVRESTYKREL